VPLVSYAGATALRPDQLAAILPITVRSLGGDQWAVSTGSREMRLTVGLPFVRTGDEEHQLATAPFVQAGKLHVPLQLVAEVLPQMASGVMWDAERMELRVFSTVARYGRPEPQVVERRESAGDVSRAPVATASSTRPGPRRPGSTRRTVVVDAGHGGPDRGMHGPIGGDFVIYEKNITLEVSKRLGAKLRQQGVDVIYTRTSDTLIALSDRGRIANDAGGDLFVSIHVNAANPNWKNPGGARGYETYFLAEAKTEDAQRVEKMENEAVRFETTADTHKGDALSFILNDMAQNEHLRESSELAELIQGRLKQIHPGPSRGVKQAGFRVLVTAFMPSVLVEIGFGTNAAEAEYISSPSRQEEIAQAIADAALEYLERYEKRIAGGAQE
jgi:N-acetylmuramoyl-L-alanine amidase